MSVACIFGYGPGISHSTAARFGAEGYWVALVGRNSRRLADGVSRLQHEGVESRSYVADAADPEAVAAVIGTIHRDLGSISMLLWTAFRSGDVSDVLNTRPRDVLAAFDVAVTGLLTATQACRADLESSPGSSILIVNGAVGEMVATADRISTTLGIDGTALGNAAKSKLAGLLAERLRPVGVYVGEIMIAGAIAGTETANDQAHGQIDPRTVADRLWTMSRERTTTRVRLPEAAFGLDL